MKTRRLGQSGFSVGAMGVGCMDLSIRERRSEDDAVRTLAAEVALSPEDVKAVEAAF
jgi:aryl-alcohol dehydrogenase-like predicted oxidoreductase